VNKLPAKEWFDERQYLQTYPDVKEKIASKAFKSGYEHYLLEGREQGYTFPFDPTRRDLITVIVPVYNAAGFIVPTLNTIASQDYRNFECVIVDDKSTDNTREVCQAYARNDSRFRLIEHKQNAGASAARNTGIRAARGRYVCFLDADDFLLENSLSNRLDALLKADLPEVAGSYSLTVHIPEETVTPPRPAPMTNAPIIDFVSAGGRCPLNTIQALVKTDVLRKFGGFNEDFIQGEDWEFWARVVRHGYVFVPSSQTAVAYRMRRGSLVRQRSADALGVFYSLSRSVYETLPEDQIVDEDVPYVYRKSWLDYRFQVDFANLFLDFAAMNESRGGDTDELETLASQLLPNYEDVVSRHVRTELILSQGIFREHALSLGTVPEAWQKFLEGRGMARIRARLRNHGDSEVLGVSLNAAIDVPGITDRFYRPGFQRSVDVVLLPFVGYHVWTLALLVPYLEAQGLSVMFIDTSIAYGDKRVREELRARDLPHVSYNQFVLGSFAPKTLVCMEDWNVIGRPVIESARRVGVQTIALVEGIQDYLDADTGRPRNAYRTAEYVLLPGKFDQKYFTDMVEKTRIVGIPRIDALSQESPPYPDEPLVVINCNFTYGVLEDKRDEWVRGTVEACQLAGVDYVISRHHAEKGDLSAYKVADESMYDLIRRGTVFVSRFSTGIIEAMAMGKAAIYHNPNVEKVDKFLEPLGAYPITDSVESLADAIRQIAANPPDRAQYQEFLDTHCNVESDKGASQRTAEAIIDITAQAPAYDRRERSIILRQVMRERDNINMHAPTLEQLRTTIAKTSSAQAASAMFQQQTETLKNDPIIRARVRAGVIARKILPAWLYRRLLRIYRGTTK